MANYKCKMCGLIFKHERKEEEESIVCPRCKSPDVAKTVDNLETLFGEGSCGVRRKSA
ncbi:MAG: zinc ribbon domain-containing protein [Actinomycetota bacterium]|nr:zinc ribbon domain-containing protein [Actinomycetota bacterium]